MIFSLFSIFRKLWSLTGLLHFYKIPFFPELIEPMVCQCPLTGLLHFYDKSDRIKQSSSRNVSMPFNGLTPFLQLTLENGFFATDVSMPFNGLTPFLRWIEYDRNNTYVVCQCPLTGLLHFYTYYSNLTIHLWEVSMPFNGLTPFLQQKKLNLQKTKNRCQCPLTGLLHFYFAGALCYYT